MNSTQGLLAVFFVSICLQSCLAQQRTQQGVVVGGVTGAVIGGLIGKQTQKTAGGAAIGGAVGAVAGGLMGRAQDNEWARRESSYQQSIYNQQQIIYQQQANVQSGVSTADVVAMGRSGVTDAVIMSQIQSRGVQRRLEVSDIISLHQQGISDTVITAMQAAPIGGQVALRQSAQPVIVQQPVFYGGTPVYVQPQPRCRQQNYFGF